MLLVAVTLQGTAGQTQEVDAVIDTGFNGYPTLPTTVVADLELPVVGEGEAVLADGGEAVFDVYGVTVVWGDQPRFVECGAVGIDPLMGMDLLDGHNLNIEVENGGRVVIQGRS